MIRRRTADLGLLSAFFLFAELSFARERTGPLAALPELFAHDAWRGAIPALVALTLAALLGAVLVCRCGERPAPLRAGLVAGAAVAGFAFLYGWCADDALRALPMIAGCHCWVAGIAGAFSALAVAALVAVLHAVVVRVVGLAIGRGAALAERARTRGVYRIRTAARPQRAGPAPPLARHGALRAPPITA